MIALAVEDGYGGSVVLVPLAHERAAVVDVRHADRMPDLMLDPHDLRELARVAMLAADVLDDAAEVIA